MNDSQNTIPASEEALAPASRLSPWAIALLAVLSYVVLADAAVETLASGSPLRWIISGAVVGYLALSGLLWRRLSWGTKASVSFFVLLGLMAFAAWRPEGSNSAITMLRQPASTLLSAVTILGILLAGWILARLKLLPWPVRVAVVVLGTYGVAAFVAGILSRTPYAALLHGQSLWKKLPFWLQGAFIGGVVVAPLGLIGEIAERIHGRWRRLDAGRSGYQQAVALAMSVVVTLTAFNSSAHQGIGRIFQHNTAELTLPVGDDLTAPDPPSKPLNPDELVTRIESWIQQTPKGRYSLTARAEALGSGVEPAFFFVRDNIRYESYSGILRGDEQTFQARSGNSFDRSLLLAKLLKLKSVPTRFVSGSLSSADAERLFARIFEPLHPDKDVPASRSAPSPGAAAFLSRVKARGRRDYLAIRAALGQSLPASASPSREDVLREIQHHVWVQAQVDGRWIDLDSSFGDATPGRSYCKVDQTLDELPSESHQHVTMRVTAETLADDQIKSETVLEATMPAEDLLDRQIFLTHTPAGQAALGGLGGTPQGGNVWAPALWVDGQFYSGKPVDFSAEGSSGGGGDLFGGAFASPPVFVAEWLEFEIAFPDGHSEVTRRILADRGLAWRKAGTPDPEALRPLARDERGPLAPRAVHNIWLSAGTHNLPAYAIGLMALLRSLRGAAADQTSSQDQPSSSSQPPPSDLSFGEQVWPLALQNFAFLVWSDHVIIPAVNDSPAVRLYPDSPRILMFSVGEGKGGGAYGEYDLRRDFLRGVAREPSAEAGVIERKIWFGALEGALEHESVAHDAAFSGNDPTKVATTSRLLTSAGTITLRPEDAAHGAKLAGEPETAARMLSSLSSGSFLVVPHSASGGDPAGWWEVTGAGNTRAVLGADLNGGYLIYTNYVNASGVGKEYIVGEGAQAGQDLGSVDLATGQRFTPGGSGGTVASKKRGGSEYITLVVVIASAVLAVLMAVMINQLYNHHKIMAALDGIEYPDAGTTSGP